MPTTFLGRVARVEDGVTYYHAFSVDGTVFGPLQYCRFTHAGMLFFGKIHSCWLDGQGVAMAEVQPFRPRPSGRKFAEDETNAFTEVIAVLGATMDIPISTIHSDKALVCWVPHEVTDDQIFEYVDINIGKKEYPDSEGEDSDDEFIVDGEVFAWYQLAVEGSSVSTVAAPPVQFVDLFMTHDHSAEPWFQQQFPYHIFENYFAARFTALVPDKSQTMHFFAKLENGTMPLQEDTARQAEAEACGAFVSKLKDLLATNASIITVYNHCVSFL
jgi:hypothetical protein